MDHFFHRKRRLPTLLIASSFIICLLAALVISKGILHSERKDEYGVMRYLFDGDTIAVDGSLGQVRVRLIGIDAPEIAHEQSNTAQEPYAREAKEALGAMLPEGSKVRLEYDQELRDKYGRLLAYVWDMQDHMINERMVRDGWADTLVIEPNTRHRVRLEIAKALARIEGKGIWRRN